MNNIIEVFPKKLRGYIEKMNTKDVTDIRISVGMPVIFMGIYKEECIENIRLAEDDLTVMVGNATENSLYSYMDNIREGFITLRGGHRMGVAGTAVNEKDKLISVKDISYINIRIAREVKGQAESLRGILFDSSGVHNTLIISPPGCGKTTLLRDISRILGNTKNMRASVIDSRFEIGAQYKGRAQKDIGERSFLLSGYSKKDGFSHAVRCLSSKVIITDEISKEDYPLVSFAANSGVSVIATVHGKSVEDVKRKFNISFFDRFVVLEKPGGEIRVYNEEGRMI